jgi:hypothetical protein
MATLTITELSCGVQEDRGLRDEVTLRFDGIPISGPHHMSSGDVIALNVVQNFTGTGAVDLIEEDGPRTPDWLGTVAVFETTVNPGLEVTGHFHPVSTFSYHMKYIVDP